LTTSKGKLVQYCKEDLGLTVSIVSNGSKITVNWLDEYGNYLDLLAVSCDSFNDKTNQITGRRERSGKSESQTTIVRLTEIYIFDSSILKGIQSCRMVSPTQHSLQDQHSGNVL
jgi:hypothetical protein